MKYTALILLIIITSCSPDENIPPDPTPPNMRYFLEVMNNTPHKIELELYSGGEVFNTYLLVSFADTVIYDYMEEPISVFRIYGDSVRVKFDDNISIYHNTELQQPASRSLMLVSSYEGGKVNDEQYVFSYEFTEEDYEEAVSGG